MNHDHPPYSGTLEADLVRPAAPVMGQDVPDVLLVLALEPLLKS